jgi:hypothetical protein
VKNGGDDAEEIQLLRMGKTNYFKRVLRTPLELHWFTKV